MSKKWKRFIRDNEHYCPYCPEAERDETYIGVAALKLFLKQQRENKPEQNVINSLMKAGYQWASVLSHPESAMVKWTILDWTVVAEQLAPNVASQITLDTVDEIRELLRKEQDEYGKWISEGIEKVYGPE